jgi:hypothetical protein
MRKFHQPPIFTWVGGGREKWQIVFTLNSMVAEYVHAKFHELVTMCLTRCQGKMLIKDEFQGYSNKHKLLLHSWVLI